MLTKIKILNRRFWAGMKTGATFTDKIKAALGLVFISKIRRLSFLMKKENYVCPVFFKTGSDVATWFEVFIENQYQLPNDFYPRKIIDLGANVGFSSLYFSLHYPLSQIVALEPDPHNQELLVKNLKGRPNVVTKSLAISGNGGKHDFFSRSNQGMSSSFFQDNGSQKMAVETVSFDGLLESLDWPDVDLVKFDIEGAEWEVFKSASIARAKVLIGEYHEDILRFPVEKFLELFSGFESKVRQIYPKRYLILFNRKI